MGGINNLIEKKRKASDSFDNSYREENNRLKAAVALMKLREEYGFSQRDLAQKVGKPQSTISRIENGNMNVTVKLLDEIAEGVGKELEISFK